MSPDRTCLSVRFAAVCHVCRQLRQREFLQAVASFIHGNLLVTANRIVIGWVINPLSLRLRLIPSYLLLASVALTQVVAHQLSHDVVIVPVPCPFCRRYLCETEPLAHG